MMKKLLPILLTLALLMSGIPAMAFAEEGVQDTAAPAVTETEEDNGLSAEEPAEPGQSSQQETAAPDSVVEETTAGNADATQETTVPVPTETETTEPATENVQEESASQTESSRVVTLGENLNAAQRASMYEYFGTTADQVKTIVVSHADEVAHMQGIATAEQIGPTTNSCSYVEPTDSGGVKVKTANLNFVTSAMIASTLTTAGMENCNVVAACPFEVSGTGALTGIMMAYETASGENLNEGQKEAAMEELITTGNLADSVGRETATEVMKEVKTEILDQGLTEPAEITEAVQKIAEDQGVTLTEEQMDQIVGLMEKISQFDYDLGALEDTLNNLDGKLSGLAGIWNSIKTFFVGAGDDILNQLNEEALGSDIITDSTVDESGFKDGLFTRIKNLFSGSDEKDAEDPEQ